MSIFGKNEHLLARRHRTTDAYPGVPGGELITEAETATKSSLKPGMLVSGGVSAAASSVVPLVVGGTGAVISESWRGTIEADAARTAEEVAKRVKKIYEARGWLP